MKSQFLFTGLALILVAFACFTIAINLEDDLTSEKISSDFVNGTHTNGGGPSVDEGSLDPIAGTPQDPNMIQDGDPVPP